MSRMRIYVASSWRNVYQPEVVERLKAAGHEVRGEAESRAWRARAEKGE